MRRECIKLLYCSFDFRKLNSDAQFMRRKAPRPFLSFRIVKEKPACESKRKSKRERKVKSRRAYLDIQLICS
jgi:hypothetical protein